MAGYSTDEFMSLRRTARRMAARYAFGLMELSDQLGLGASVVVLMGDDLAASVPFASCEALVQVRGELEPLTLTLARSPVGIHDVPAAPRLDIDVMTMAYSPGSYGFWVLEAP